jgi:HPt (histidine-containing phosphotransfer) domain-containing protein
MKESQKQRFAEALARVAGDEDILRTLASITAEDAPELLSRLERQREAGDWDDYAKTAHAVKGMFSAFETGQPVCRLEEVIDAARKQQPGDVQKWHDALLADLHALLDEIKAIA